MVSTDTSQEKSVNPNKHILKKCFASFSLSGLKCKLKSQGDTTTYLLKGLKLKRPTIPSVGGNIKWYNHFGKKFGSFS